MTREGQRWWEGVKEMFIVRERVSRQVVPALCKSDKR